MQCAPFSHDHILLHVYQLSSLWVNWINLGGKNLKVDYNSQILGSMDVLTAPRLEIPAVVSNAYQVSTLADSGRQCEDVSQVPVYQNPVTLVDTVYIVAAGRISLYKPLFYNVQ